MTRSIHRSPEPAPPADLPPHAKQFWALSMDVFRAIDAGDAPRALGPLAELERLYPGDPQLAQYRKVAAVVGFECAGERRAYEPTLRDPPESASVDLVAFHVDLPASPSGIHERVDYLGVLRQAFEAARLRAPQARRILLTDETTRVPADVGADEVVRVALDASRVMYERMRAQARYLEARESSRSSVLMDVDVVVNRDPAEAFAEAFDLGLTYRLDSKDAPFNGGVLLAAPGDGALRFLRRTLACYDALADSPAVAPYYRSNLRSWWGDQFAWYVSVGQRAFSTRTHEGLEVDGVRLAFFHGGDYNYTVDSAAEAADPALASKHFLHFKGNRKPWIADYLAAIRARGT